MATYKKIAKNNNNLYWSLSQGFYLCTLLEKPLGWKAVYKDKKGYFTFEGINDIRSYFITKEDKLKIKEALK